MDAVMVRKSCSKMPKIGKKKIGSSIAKLFISNMIVNTDVWGVKKLAKGGDRFLNRHKLYTCITEKNIIL